MLGKVSTHHRQVELNEIVFNFFFQVSMIRMIFIVMILLTIIFNNTFYDKFC